MRNLCAMIVFFFQYPPVAVVCVVKDRQHLRNRCSFCEKSVCNDCIHFSVRCSSSPVSVVKDRQHLRIDVVSVRNLCAMIVFFFSNSSSSCQCCKGQAVSQDRCGFCEKSMCNDCILFQ